MSFSMVLVRPSSWHIPELEGPSYPRPEIPCLCGLRGYDKKGFSNFPSRKGWRMDPELGPVRLDGTSPTNKRIAAFLQSWMWFGMLHEILLISGVDVDLSTFVRYEDIDPVLNTRPLRQHFSDMIDRGADSATVAEKEQAMIKVFREVDWWFRMFMDSASPTKWRITSVLSLDTIMSILILGESLVNAAAITLRSRAVTQQAQFPRFKNPMEERMLARGWCPSTTTMLHGMLDNTGLYIASLMKLSGVTGRQSHELCTVESCEANYVSEETYETSHTETCRQLAILRGGSGGCCSHVEVDVAKVCEILRRGGTPVVEISTYGPDDREIKLEVKESSTYVALSHVWAQGLGNAKANSLPQCQLFRLMELTRKLEITGLTRVTTSLEQPPIWIDTLCIPVHPDLKADRKAAIVGLATTFRNASQVLVLDADVQTSPVSASRLERATRILCSGWMRRLWTYQEAIISQEGSICEKLMIRFSDGTAPFHSLGEKQQGVMTLCHSQKAVQTLYNILPLVEDSKMHFSTLIRALRYRSTSRLDDEPICLASVLGHDVQEISQTKCVQRRMALFYSYINELPADIIFLKIDNLDIDGYRWAPKSFLNQARTLTGSWGSTDTMATRDQHGLYVNFRGFRILDVQLPSLPGSYFSIRTSSHQGAAEGELEGGVPCYTSTINKEEVLWRHAMMLEFERVIKTTQRLAVIINPARGKTYSLLVNVLREENGTIFCKYLQVVCVNSVSAHPVTRGSIVVERLSEDQRWCVG